MPDSQARAVRFETHRPHLLAVATRLLGSTTEAEDAVQEAWLRFDRAGDDGIENLGGWLTTVVSRICLDHLRTRSARAEEPVEDDLLHLPDDDPNPEDTAIRSESTAEALSIVMETLSPVERVAFVLHDVFGTPFEEIAAIVGRSPDAVRQLASRGRRRLQTASASVGLENGSRHREIVEAFFRASRSGDLRGLLALLDPNVALRADETALRMGVSSGFLTSELQGADAVAEQFSGAAQAAQLALINGAPGAVWAAGGKLRLVFRFVVERGAIVEITLIADPDVIASMNIETGDESNG